MYRLKKGACVVLASLACSLPGSAVFAQSSNGFFDTIKQVVSDPALGSMIMSKLASPSAILPPSLRQYQNAYDRPDYQAQNGGANGVIPGDAQYQNNYPLNTNQNAETQSPLGRLAGTFFAHPSMPSNTLRPTYGEAQAEPSALVPNDGGGAANQVTFINKIAPAELRQLSQFDISVLIDKSGSMATRDCPSQSYYGANVSRWEWCREQSALLSHQTDNAFPAGISLVPFANAPQRFDGVRPEGINTVFNSITPGGSTNLAGALESELDRYFQNRDNGMRQRPLMIAVITDGVPDSKSAVRRVLQEAAAAMTRPEEIKVVFFLIGQDQSGSNFTEQLSQRLGEDGAKFNIVSSHSFAEVNHIGLARSLALSAMQ